MLAIGALTLLAAASSEIGAAERLPLGELEEPGEVERRPVGEADAPPEANGDDTAAGTVGDANLAESTSGAVEEELHEDEATEILPDSEAVDETIEAVEELEAPEEKDGTEPTAEAKPVPPPEPNWRIRWQNAFIVERVDDPSYQFLFGGRAQNDWGAYVPDDDLEEDFGGDGTGTKFRRARIYFLGQFFRFGFFKIEYDFSERGNDTEFTDVYAGITLKRIGLFRVGHFKEPISLQFQNSSNFTSFNERAGIQAFSPGRNTGMMLNGNFLARDSTYSLGFFRRTDDVGEGFSNNEDYRISGRITALPYYEEGGERLLHVEFGYSHQFADKTTGTRYAFPASSDFAPDLVDTGVLTVSDVDLFNVGVAVVDGSYAFQAEASLSLPYSGIDENPVFWGAYAEVSWWLTGERRRYLRGRGVFSRVVPKKRFDPDTGEWGAFELATRVSWLDLSDGGVRGGTLGEWTVALNWVLFSNLRMSNNYALARAGDRAGSRSGLAHTWLTRFQIDF